MPIGQYKVKRDTNKLKWKHYSPKNNMIAYPIKIQCVCPNHPEPVCVMYNDVFAFKTNQNKCFFKCWVGQPVSAVEPKHQDHDCNHQRSSVTLENCCRRQIFQKWHLLPWCAGTGVGWRRRDTGGWGGVVVPGSFWHIWPLFLVGGFTTLGK